MPSVRQFGLSIALTRLGQSTVITEIPPEDLLTKLDPRVDAPALPSARNCRLLDGTVSPRSGYAALGSTGLTVPINGAYLAMFSSGAAYPMIGTATDMFIYSASTWTSIKGARTINATATDTWCFANVRNAGGNPDNQVFCCNGVDNMFRYDGGVALLDTGSATFQKVRAIVGHRGRALCMNTYETTPRPQRVRYSIVGDPEDFTGTGSGYVDLDDDPFEIVAATVLGGNIAVFKGNNVGGSIVVGTPTGVPTSPYRWDTIGGKESSVGILYPRTLLNLSPGLAFFIGHDGIYLYDGSRGLVQVAKEIARQLLDNANLGALRGGFAWYKPRSFEITFGIPYGSSSWPSEWWVYNLVERRIYGPYSYHHTLTAAAPYNTSVALTWLSLSGTWLTLPYTTWLSISGSAGNPALMLCGYEGAAFQDDDTATTDDGNAYSAVLTTPVIRPAGRLATLPDGSRRMLHEDDTLVLHEINLIYRDLSTWTPTIEYCTDGTNWTTVASGSSIGTSTNREQVQSYTLADAAPGNWFQVRVTGNVGMYLNGIRLDFGVGGSWRSQ